MSSPTAAVHLQPKLEPNQVQWGKFMVEIYLAGEGPQPLGTVSFEEIEKKAKEKLKEWPGAFMYAGGSAGTDSTYHANLAYLRSLRIIPRMLQPANTRSLSTTLFGVRYPSPILLAPIGVQGTFYEEGELASARAAGKLGIPFICSTASSRSIERVAIANEEFAQSNADDKTQGALWNLSLVDKNVPVSSSINAAGTALASRWYQLYWPFHNSVTSSLLSRAKTAGYSVLVVTLDTMSLGWRPHDLERSYLPFMHGVGIEVGRTDPVWMAMQNHEPPKEHQDTEASFPYIPDHFHSRIQGLSGTPEEQAKAKKDADLGKAWLMEANSGVYRSWEDLELLMKAWDGPIVLKGIQRVKDAEKAAEILMADGREGGIVVSNHGGRQVDGGIPSILALERIMGSPKVQAARNPGSGKPKFHVLFDSGIRTGSDVLKAVMLGADGVLIGRPYVYAAVLAGQAGVEAVLKYLLTDLEVTMGLAGWDSLDEVRGKGLDKEEEVLIKVDLPN